MSTAWLEYSAVWRGVACTLLTSDRHLRWPRLNLYFRTLIARISVRHWWRCKCLNRVWLYKYFFWQRHLQKPSILHKSIARRNRIDENDEVVGGRDICGAADMTDFHYTPRKNFAV